MDKPTSSGSRSSDRGGWLGALEQDGQSSPLWRLPEALTDPFASPQKRLTAILDSYRFSKEPRSLIEWAVAQTGLADPLTKYTRHELEHGFEGFARNRESHLKELVRQFKRQGHLTLLQDALASPASAAVRTALEKAMRG